MKFSNLLNSLLFRRVLALAASVVLGASILGLAPPAEAKAEAAPTSTGLIAIENAATGKCINVPGQTASKPDGSVKQFTCNDTRLENMRWQLWRQPGTYKGYARFLIMHEFTANRERMCLDLPGFKAVPKTTRITTYPCRPDGDNQVFYAKKTSRGWMFVHEMSKNLCIDVAGTSSKKNDQPLTLWPCDPKGDHDWILRTPRQKMVPTWKQAGACSAGSGNVTVPWGPNLATPEVRVRLITRLWVPLHWDNRADSFRDPNEVWARGSDWTYQKSKRGAITGGRGYKVYYTWHFAPDFLYPGVVCVEVKGFRASD